MVFSVKFVEGYTKRKNLINKTSVGPYNYAINHVQGCAHGCKYPCFAYIMAFRHGRVNSYAQWIQPYLVENALQLIDQEIPKIKSKTDSVHLCFATDPFMYGYEEIADMSIKIIRKLNYSGINCTVLTKGILPFELAGLSTDNEYGISLASLDENYRRKVEPGAASYYDRVQALHRLHLQGCKTYVNIEPYPTPNMVEQDIFELLEAVSFVDWIGFGKLNYNKQIEDYPDHEEFYRQTRQDIRDFCATMKIACYIHG